VLKSGDYTYGALQSYFEVDRLETFYDRGYLPDLRACFRQLITYNVTSINACSTVACELWDFPHPIAAYWSRAKNQISCFTLEPDQSPNFNPAVVSLKPKSRLGLYR